jgi:hypothetical protein
LQEKPNIVKQRLFQTGKTPVCKDTLYDEDALKAIRNIQIGRPQKPAPEALQEASENLILVLSSIFIIYTRYYEYIKQKRIFFRISENSTDNGYMELKPFQIWQRLDDEAKRTKKALNQAASSTGISSGTMSDWKNSFPRVDLLASVVKFYDSSLDYVVFGEIQGNAISVEENSLFTRFRQLDSRDQADVLGIVEMKLENAKKGDILSSSVNA